MVSDSLKLLGFVRTIERIKALLPTTESASGTNPFCRSRIRLFARYESRGETYVQR